MADVVFLNGNDTFDVLEIVDGGVKVFPVGDGDSYAVHHPILINDLCFVSSDCFQKSCPATSSVKEDNEGLGIKLLARLFAGDSRVTFDDFFTRSLGR